MDEGAPDQLFRRVMGAFATGVTVVSASGAGGRMAGITVNSLTSVSLNPRLLLWCLGDQSERYDFFAAADVWGVTVLGAADEDLARRFARAETEVIGAGEADEHSADSRFGVGPASSTSLLRPNLDGGCVP